MQSSLSLHMGTEEMSREDTWEDSRLHTREERPTETNPDSTVITSQSPELWEPKFLLLKPPSLRVSSAKIHPQEKVWKWWFIAMFFLLGISPVLPVVQFLKVVVSQISSTFNYLFRKFS